MKQGMVGCSGHMFELWSSVTTICLLEQAMFWIVRGVHVFHITTRMVVLGGSFS